MATWQLQDAKARFSELINTAETDGPQLITRHGVETAVVVPFQQWLLLSAPTPPQIPKRVLTNDEFLSLLRSAPDFEIPDRHTERRKKRVRRSA